MNLLPELELIMIVILRPPVKPFLGEMFNEVFCPPSLVDCFFHMLAPGPVVRAQTGCVEFKSRQSFSTVSVRSVRTLPSINEIDASST